MEQNNPTNSAPASQGGPQAQSNLALYNQFREVPDEAKKAIVDGRLKGKTDVNPMWRIKKLTEAFGPCGIGWTVSIVRKWLEQGDDDTVAAFVDVELRFRDPATGQWSEPVPGTGGNVFRKKESSGKIYIDDDCYKKALTDAVSIAAKFLGVAADVFYAADPSSSKYETSAGKGQGQQATVRNRPATQQQTAQQPATKPVLSKSSPYWLSSISTAMGTSDPIPTIRQRIEKKFTISDADFLDLMKAAGKVAQDAKSA